LKISDRPYKKLFIIFLIFLFIISGFVCFYVSHNFKNIKNYVEKHSNDKPFSVSLVLSVIKVESNFNADAVSSKNAKGLMQIKDDTFEFVCEKYDLDLSGSDIFDAEKNIIVGITYLGYLYEKYKDIDLALCAYNAGEGNIDKWLSDKRYSSDGKELENIPFKETDDYIKKIKFYERVFSVL